MQCEHFSPEDRQKTNHIQRFNSGKHKFLEIILAYDLLRTISLKTQLQKDEHTFLSGFSLKGLAIWFLQLTTSFVLFYWFHLSQEVTAHFKCVFKVVVCTVSHIKNTSMLEKTGINSPIRHKKNIQHKVQKQLYSLWFFSKIKWRSCCFQWFSRVFHVKKGWY